MGVHKNTADWFSGTPDAASPYGSHAAMSAIAQPTVLAAHAQTSSAADPAYLANTLPFVVAAKPGADVSLQSILTKAFGSDFGGYQDFYLGYYGASALSTWDFSYWDPSHSSVAKWLVNGSDIGASTTTSFNSVHVSAADASTATLEAGNDIGDLAFVIVPVAFDSDGNATEYDQLSVITADPKLIGKHAGNGHPSVNDIISSANAFSKAYSGAPNDNDCHKIACAVAGAAGAAFNDDTTYSLDPSQNQSQGFWRIAYSGAQKHPVADWQTLVKAGDIVRMGWQGGGQHTCTVLAVNKNGSIKVFDNDDHNSKGVEDIGTHSVNYDQQTIASTVTIYRLSPDHLYLINGSGIGEHLAGTSFNDQMEGLGGNDTLGGWKGNDVLHGGSGNDTLTGGADADTLNGASGKDSFIYDAVSDSTSKQYDTIESFDAKADRFRFDSGVGAVDKAVTKGTLDSAHFDGDLAGAIKAASLHAGDAVLFTANKGDLKGDTFLIVDANGNAGYQAGKDFVIDLSHAANLSHLSVHDFTVSL